MALPWKRNNPWREADIDVHCVAHSRYFFVVTVDAVLALTLLLSHCINPLSADESCVRIDSRQTHVQHEHSEPPRERLSRVNAPRPPERAAGTVQK